MGQEEAQAYVNEAKLLTIIDHPNVIKMKKLYESAQFIFIVMELALGGTLESYLKERSKEQEPLTDYESSVIIKQILEGLRSIHKQDVIHRDISLKNIMLKYYAEIETGILIVDFGLGAKISEYNSSLIQRCGTMLYMAPELITGNKYSKVTYLLNK